jgi:diaminopimelate epimerase
MSRHGETLRFTKMHGIGNDYVYVNLFDETVPDPASLAVAVSDRHFGVGADGLILIGPSHEADVSMRIFNADGSEAQMCGNGIRCVAKYAYDQGIVTGDTVRVETRSGIKTIQLFIESGLAVRARVDMGEPRLTRGDIPMTGPSSEQCVSAPLTAGGQEFEITCVSMGNPHCVIYVNDVEDVDLVRVGPAIERHAAFPERTNVHFVQVVGLGEVRMRTWERGSGVTMACGTGASAVGVAGVLTRCTNRRILAHLPGGDLEIEWAENNHVFMTGPAAKVFNGEWPLT